MISGADLKPRRGRFSLTREAIWSSDYDLLKVVFGDIIVVRAEFLFAEDKLEYTAMSPKFDEIQEGGQIPEYVCHVNTSTVDGGQKCYEVRWVKK